MASDTPGDGMATLIAKWRQKAEVCRANAERYDAVGEDRRSAVNDRAWLEISKCADELESVLSEMHGAGARKKEK